MYVICAASVYYIVFVLCVSYNITKRIVACLPCHVPQCRSCLVMSQFPSRISHYSVVCVQQNKRKLGYGALQTLLTSVHLERLS